MFDCTMLDGIIYGAVWYNICHPKVFGSISQRLWKTLRKLNPIDRNSHILIYSIFPVAVILSCRLWCFWEGADSKRCFSVNAKPLQWHCKTVSAVDKLCKTVSKFGKTVAYTSKSHTFYLEKYDFLPLKVILFVYLATVLQILSTVSPVLSLTQWL